MVPIPSDRKGLTLKYSSGIAPLVTAKQYSDLIANYKKTGVFPHILDLGGMAIDTSRNRNKWRVPLEDLQAIADQLKGLPLMKDHDIDHVDSIIGKVEEAWVEPDKNDPTAGKVFWKGETSDESLIQKILLGYIKHNSIQIAVPNAYCDDCMTAQGKSEQEAAIEDLDLPCPRCGSLNMLIRHPMALEQSIIAIPAYEHADITPYGFKASMDFALRARYEPKVAPSTTKPVPQVAKARVFDPMPTLFKAYNAVGLATIGVAEMQLRMAKMALEGYPEDRVEIRYKQKARDLGANKPIVDEGFTPEEQAFLDSLGQPTEEPMEEPLEEAKGGSLEDFPLVEKGGEKKRDEAERMTIADINNRDDLVLVTDSQDVAFVKEMYPQAKDYDSFFVKVGEGEYTELYGFEGSVAALDKTLYKIEIDTWPSGSGVTDSEGNPIEFYPEPEEADALGIPRPEQEEVSEYVGAPCPECKIDNMVDDQQGGAFCPNCGYDGSHDSESFGK